MPSSINKERKRRGYRPYVKRDRNRSGKKIFDEAGKDDFKRRYFLAGMHLPYSGEDWTYMRAEARRSPKEREKMFISRFDDDNYLYPNTGSYSANPPRSGYGFWSEAILDDIQPRIYESRVGAHTLKRKLDDDSVTLIKSFLQKRRTSTSKRKKRTKK